MRWPWSKKNKQTEETSLETRSAAPKRVRNKHYILYCECHKPVVVTKKPVPRGAVLTADNVIALKHSLKKHWKNGDELMCRSGKKCPRNASTTYSTRNRLIKEQPR